MASPKKTRKNKVADGAKFRPEKEEKISLKQVVRDERTRKITGAVSLLIAVFLVALAAIQGSGLLRTARPQVASANVQIAEVIEVTPETEEPMLTHYEWALRCKYKDAPKHARSLAIMVIDDVLSKFDDPCLSTI